MLNSAKRARNNAVKKNLDNPRVSTGYGTTAPRGSDRFAYNQHSGHSNDGRLQQMTQAPNRRGNRDAGSRKTGAPDHAQGSAQYRGVGGTPRGGPGFANPDRIRVR